MSNIGSVDLTYVETEIPQEASWGEKSAKSLDNWIQFIASNYIFSKEYKTLSEPEKDKYIYTRAQTSLKGKGLHAIVLGALIWGTWKNTQIGGGIIALLVVGKIASNYFMKDAYEKMQDEKVVEDKSIQTIEQCQQLTDAGDREAQYHLGLCYYRGRDVEQSFEKAAELFRLSANLGYAKAQINLGFCYSNGKGVEKNLTEAIKMYRLAADQKNVQAQYNLGFCYYKGRGVNKNLQEAVKWFQLAANQNDTDAQYNLGRCYYKGRGIKQNFKKAADLFRQAASNDNMDAQYMLGICYAKGKGVKRNLAEAKKWYKRAAALGDERAKISLQRITSHTRRA